MPDLQTNHVVVEPVHDSLNLADAMALGKSKEVVITS